MDAFQQLVLDTLRDREAPDDAISAVEQMDPDVFWNDYGGPFVDQFESLTPDDVPLAP